MVILNPYQKNMFSYRIAMGTGTHGCSRIRNEYRLSISPYLNHIYNHGFKALIITCIGPGQDRPSQRLVMNGKRLIESTTY